jgi:hypothetical protein
MSDFAASNLVADLRHAAKIIGDADILQRRDRFVKALDKYADDIESGALEVKEAKPAENV